ncbi:hypothetical protein VFPPC_16721 [Pochonia chlamydosporia 170]|uniref:Uncharacterized protein n=1 Tax=Pochonia chlamydosporia 170 TaxID=1380566 RepID=A0A179F752_METCM|nr:hypothetical protein VFPPC_16721 [Pochonia chlamydosporia 170]OAQ61242.1 hypothetical protein VFPPC_16721 [Pochonia chlamydosporia 170]
MDREMQGDMAVCRLTRRKFRLLRQSHSLRDDSPSSLGLDFASNSFQSGHHRMPSRSMSCPHLQGCKATLLFGGSVLHVSPWPVSPSREDLCIEVIGLCLEGVCS